MLNGVGISLKVLLAFAKFPLKLSKLLTKAPTDASCTFTRSFIARIRVEVVSNCLLNLVTFSLPLRETVISTI